MHACLHPSAVKEPHSLHGLLEEVLQPSSGERVLGGVLEVLVVIMPSAKILLAILRKLFDDSVNVLSKGVIVVETLGHLLHPLCVCVLCVCVCVCVRA